jgi:hypothetical protein
VAAVAGVADTCSFQPWRRSTLPAGRRTHHIPPIRTDQPPDSETASPASATNDSRPAGVTPASTA